MTIDAGLGPALELLLQGIWPTLLVTACAYLIAAALGMVVALMRVSPVKALRLCGAAYVEVLRGMPSLVMVLLIYFGLSDLLPMPPMVAAITGLALVNTAYLAEYYRAGIEAVPRGQREAAEALGLTGRQVFWRIIWRQGVRVALPPSTSQAIGMLKESAVISAIGVADITFQALTAAHRGAPPIQLFAIAGGLYLCLSIPIAVLSRTVEHRMQNRTAA
ncbi:amino acid ABC transporter permease [Aeromicrobium tamlense]|uniref:Amino acid ABC transporter permease n=1 Tax=Aeromicrobium tamlense TaxID=375541 RepID=A0A8I0FZG6_9ACTN|nr:amino acid ABC transporter permease [Aeromicrobium tamlense]MBD1270762.1 amino acid ABC transporter permease [Aeromicrobium tamlense]MBD1271106.1 amino acid ABC transporter permease [Aeromicrobium tamlense]NYI38154.1 polar amino acid transport system permease protein [Aeromicrobium tamlense]